LTAVAAQAGWSRPTVRKYLTADSFPEWAPRRTLLRAGSGYTVYLQHSWVEGCRDAAVLCSEWPAQGFTGSRRMVQRAVAVPTAGARPTPTWSAGRIHRYTRSRQTRSRWIILG
jgi:hypothetical protein